MAERMRPMNLADLAEVLRLDSDNFILSWNKESYIRELETNDYAYLYVIEVDNRIVGFIDYWITFEVCQLAKIVTDKKERGKHYAFKMMNFMNKMAKEKGCEVISLEVRRSNLLAIKFYEYLGYIKINERKSYYQDNYEDALVYMLAVGGN